MKIPEDKIQEIREATDIVEIVSQYVTLKKKGKTFMGLCPFHTEKTPSFSVDPVRGFYHCFGCGAGGNVFTFLMETEKINFPEAVKTLAEKAGISLPIFSDERASDVENLYQANQFAAQYFRQVLLKKQAGKPALDYLTGRGFKAETIDTFMLGFAPEIWDGLLKRAEKEGFSTSILEKAGLISRRKDGRGYFDRFRGRLMFPVMNISGRIVGFGARILIEDPSKPKYINTAETPVYQKSRLLYGLFVCRQGIRREEKLLLVEGYTDVMRFHQCGFDFAVASSGTALTEEQARLVRRYTDQVVLVYDGDSAGFQAALRGIDVLLAEGLHVEIASLPRGSDPDSFLRDRGAEAMKDLLKSTRTFIEFRLHRLQSAKKMQTPSQRAAAARILLETISKIKDPVERALMIKDLGEKIGIDEAILADSMKSEHRQTFEQTPPGESEPSLVEKAEMGLLRLLLEGGSQWALPIFKYIKPHDFTHKVSRQIADRLYQGYLKGRIPDAKELPDGASDGSVARLISNLLTEPLADDLDRLQYGIDCMACIREHSIRKQMDHIKSQIQSHEKQHLDTQELAREWMELKNQLAALRTLILEAWKKDVEI
ncbi:MAG TPA: DNA primase [bacterium]|nr:DNA primase [bacterium]